MTVDKTGLREWTIDTDALTTVHLWIPPDCGEDIARAALNHQDSLSAGEHGTGFELEVKLPDGRTGYLELTCATLKRTSRSIIDTAGDYGIGPDDDKLIDPDWDWGGGGRRIAKALTAYDTAADLPTRLTAARTLANTVRAAMVGGTERPATTAAEDDQAATIAQNLTEAAEEFDRAAQGSGWGDTEHHAAVELAREARAAADYLSTPVTVES